MPPGAGGTGLGTPAFNDLRGRHLGVGKKPASPLFASTVATKPAKAHRLAHDHLFEDRAPPLSRRRSPNDPSDISMAAPVRRLPRDSESYSGRVGQAENAETFQGRHYMCVCPRAFAGAGLPRRAEVSQRPTTVTSRCWRRWKTPPRWASLRQGFAGRSVTRDGGSGRSIRMHLDPRSGLRRQIGQEHEGFPGLEIAETNSP